MKIQKCHIPSGRSIKTCTKGNNDVPGITKYGSPVRLDAQTVALRPHYAECTPVFNGAISKRMAYSYLLGIGRASIQALHSPIAFFGGFKTLSQSCLTHVTNMCPLYIWSGVLLQLCCAIHNQLFKWAHGDNNRFLVMVFRGIVGTTFPR